MTPELKTAVSRTLMPDAIDRHHEYAVGDRVRALNGLPGGELRRAGLGFILGMPTDRRRIEQNLRVRKRREPRCLRVPLIPTNQGTNFGDGCFKSDETEIPRREVILLVKQRIVWNMHLAVQAKVLALRPQHDQTVVVNARRAFH